jgi:hypothetical protein
MKRIDERELREELVKLRAEHRELDDQIILLEDQASADQLLVKRLKKRKLAIKDRMTAPPPVDRGNACAWADPRRCPAAAAGTSP